MPSKHTSWGKVANWYDKVVHDDDSYQVKVVLPNILRILTGEKGKKIIDIACGEGFFARALAATGAQVTGVDVAPELIEIANNRAGHNEQYIVTPADNLSKLSSGFYDAGYIILAIQNIDNFSKALKEASRVIKKGGAFIIVMNHPIFRIPDKTSWGFDEEKKVQYRRIDAYLSESKKAIDMNPGAKPGVEKKETLTFHRPLQVYAKALFNAGFAIGRIEEWTSHKESERGPRQGAEDKSRKEIPMFMCLECIKL